MEANVVTSNIKVNKKNILESFTSLSRNTEDIAAVGMKLQTKEKNCRVFHFLKLDSVQTSKFIFFPEVYRKKHTEPKGLIISGCELLYNVSKLVKNHWS